MRKGVRSTGDDRKVCALTNHGQNFGNTSFALRSDNFMTIAPPTTKVVFATGAPRFASSRLQYLVGKGDLLSAWLEGMNDLDPLKLIASVGGNFAVGLTDASGRTFLAVDRFSVQTLCYTLAGGRLRFASRAHELAGPNSEIDPQAIFDYLYFHVIPSPRTVYRGIYRLPPGHYAVFENGGLTSAPYWEPTFSESRNVSFDALKSEFRQLLDDAVRDQLDGGKPACFLSGGTDSSTVTGVIQRVGSSAVDTYSIGFDAQGYDEMEYARLAARHFKAKHHEYYVTPDDLVQHIPAVAAHFDQPFGNSSVLPAYCCARMARDDGVTRMLAGDGGDELFGGNSRYSKQHVFGLYGHVPALLQKSVLEPLLSTRAAAAFRLTRKANSYVEQARIPMPDRLQLHNLIMRLRPEEVLTGGMLGLIDTTLPLQWQRAVWHRKQSCSPLNQELAYDWRLTLGESDLPKVVGATSLAGVSVGFPLLDDRLLAFSLSLPTSYKLKGLQLRWFFKEALRGFLPDEILTKKKKGFGLPFGVWASTTPRLKALATESLEGLADRGIVRADFIRELLSRKLAEHPGYYGEMVWILMMLVQWLRAKAPQFRVT